MESMIDFCELLKNTPFYSIEKGFNFPLTPVGDKVFIYPDPLPKKYDDGKIYISEKYREFYSSGRGVILSTGAGYYTKKGSFRKMQLKVGQRVIYNKDVPWKQEVLGADEKEHIVVLCGEQDVWIEID